jgi:hypothetical protein
MSEIPKEYQFYEVYAFFGGCFIVVVVFFGLAVLGIAHIGIVIGVVALVGAVICGYVLVREARSARL